MKSQIPNPKSQIISNIQILKIELRRRFDYLNIEIWNLSGIWNLEFGI
jgi:hypothetical protein